jgi:hypothetical protein
MSTFLNHDLCAPHVIGMGAAGACSQGVAVPGGHKSVVVCVCVCVCGGGGGGRGRQRNGHRQCLVRQSVKGLQELGLCEGLITCQQLQQHHPCAPHVIGVEGTGACSQGVAVPTGVTCWGWGGGAGSVC